MFRPADEPTRRLPWAALAAVVLIGVAGRAAMGLWLPTDGAFLERLPDQVEYVELARGLIDGGGLVYVDDRYAAPQPLRAQRTAGYPLFVALHGGNVTAVRLTQAVFDGLTALAVALIARSVLPGRWPPVVAAGVVVASPFLAYFTALVLSETLFTAMLAWGTLGLVWGRRRAGHWWWGMALLALSAHVRPAGAAVAVALALVASLLPGGYGRQPGAATSRWPLPAGLTAVLLVALSLLPWALRNSAVLGEPVWTSTNGGITLYDGWQPNNATGGSDQAFVARMPQLMLMDEVERSAYLRDKAFEAIADDPGRAAVLAARKALRTWSPVPLSEIGSPAAVAVGLAWSIPVFLLAAIGLFAGRTPPAARALLVTPAVVLTLAAVVTVGSIRYRLPADPLLGVLAAAGVQVVIERRRPA